MIEWYIYSFVIYMFVIVCELYLLEDKMKENGWKGESKSNKSPVAVLIAVSAIPIFRFLMAVMFVVMATYTKTQFDEWVETLKNEE